MADPAANPRPAHAGEPAATRRRLETLWRWRRAALWAPVCWFPLLLFRLLAGRPEQAVALGLAGLCFAAIARAAVLGSRCPACGAVFRRSAEARRRIWEEAACSACGVSLFALRRGA